MESQSITYKFIAKLGGFILTFFDFLTSIFTKNNAIYPSEYFSDNKLLEDNFNIIYKEFNNILKQGKLENVDKYYKLNTDIGQNKDWKAFPLIVYNYTMTENINLCPETFKIIKKIPNCTNAMFSVLSPGKHILPHRGVYKGVIRCLFCIQAPKNDSCWIKVNGTKIPFKTGKAIYFDETFVHEVKNESEEIRVVLYLDLYRKLPFPLNTFNKIIFNLLRKSPYIKNIINAYSVENKINISS